MTRPDGFYADIATEREADREKIRKEFEPWRDERPNQRYGDPVWESFQAGYASRREEIDGLRAAARFWMDKFNLETEQYTRIGYIQHGAIPIDPRGADTIYMVSEEGFDGCTVPVFTKAVINKGE